MKKLSYEEVFFLRQKLQRSMNLCESPQKKTQRKRQFQPKTIPILKSIIPALSKISFNQKQQVEKEINKWMIKQQKRIKIFYQNQIERQNPQDYKLKMSDQIKIRSQQDWIKLKLQKNFQQWLFSQIGQLSPTPKKNKSKNKATKTKKETQNSTEKYPNQFEMLRLSKSPRNQTQNKKKFELKLEKIQTYDQGPQNQHRKDDQNNFCYLGKKYEAEVFESQKSEQVIGLSVIKQNKKFTASQKSQEMFETMDSTPKNMIKKITSQNSPRNIRLISKYLHMQKYSYYEKSTQKDYSKLQERLNNILNNSKEKQL